jgi:hypothetical protein
LRASGDLTGAKGGAEKVLRLTALDEVEAHVGRELGVSDWQLVSQENLDALAQENLDAPAQVTGEEQLGHVELECCPSTTA